jgi:hypothetical protein
MLRFFKTGSIILSLIVAVVILWVSIKSTLRQQGGPAIKEEVIVEEIENEEKPVESEHRKDEFVGEVYAQEEITKGDSSVEEIRSYIKEIFGEGEGFDWALVIVGCESHFNPSAENPLGFYGLFQFHPGTYANCGGVDIWDWREQVRVTKECMYDYGRQWEYPVCHKKYLANRG